MLFGEVLFDCFPDGREVIGGAPFNVARHLQGFGLNPLFISRVGDDARGGRVRDVMDRWQMDTAGLQLDPDRPTGRVNVTFAGAEPCFDILPDQAFDSIAAGPMFDLVGRTDACILYHGTLISRSDASRDTLNRLREELQTVPVFVDVNLRDPWWEPVAVHTDLDRAVWVKMNEDELGQLCEDYVEQESGLDPAAALARKHGVQGVVVTRGPAGAAIRTEAGSVALPAPVVEDLVDTVGAGDAFSAVTLFGLLAGWPPSTILQRALVFAADTCRFRGATPDDPAFYSRIRMRSCSE